MRASWNRKIERMNSAKEPVNGTPKPKRATTRNNVPLNMPTIIGGTIMPMRISCTRIGETIS